MSHVASYTIRDAAQEGLTATEAGQLLGVSADAARRRAARAHLNLCPAAARRGDMRSAVADMAPLDAVNYLLDRVESLQAALAVPSVPPFGLGPKEARVFALLTKRPRQLVSHHQVFEAIYWDQHEDARPGAEIVKVWLSRLRSKVPPSFGRFRVRQGLGYVFEPGPEFMS